MKLAHRARPWLALLLAAASGFGLALLWHQTAGAGGIPATPSLHYSGTIRENGAPFTGTKSVAVSLWTSEASGARVCETAEPAAPIEGGRFRIALGEECLVSVRTNPNLWVEVAVSGVSFARKKLGAVPYAVEAERAASADSIPFSGVSGIAANTEWPGTIAAGKIAGLRAPPQHQSGMVSLGGDMTGWTLGEGTGDRRFTMRVNFTTAFSGTPVVQTMINFFDASGATGMRLDAKPVNVDATGFTLQARTWADSVIYGLRVVWIADVPGG